MEPLTIVNFVLSLAALGASVTAYRAISKKDQETAVGWKSASSRAR